MTIVIEALIVFWFFITLWGAIRLLSDLRRIRNAVERLSPTPPIEEEPDRTAAHNLERIEKGFR